MQKFGRRQNITFFTNCLFVLDTLDTAGGGEIAYSRVRYMDTYILRIANGDFVQCHSLMYSKYRVFFTGPPPKNLG